MTPTPENVEAARPVSYFDPGAMQVGGRWVNWDAAADAWCREFAPGRPILLMMARLANGQTIIVRAKGGVK
jgi:hypothetical protein